MGWVLKLSDFEYDCKGALLSCCVVGGVGTLDDSCGRGTSPNHGVCVAYTGATHRMKVLLTDHESPSNRGQKTVSIKPKSVVRRRKLLALNQFVGRRNIMTQGQKTVVNSAPVMTVNVDSAANMFSVSKSTFLRHVKKGLFPAPIKIGRATRWLIADLQDFCESKSARL